jgi:hypothetical protein
MRKSAVVMPIVALVAGLFGFLFRRMEVNTIFDPVTGLAERNATATLIVILISIAAVGIFVAFAVLAASRFRADREYTKAFAPKGFVYLGISFLLMLAWLVADVLYFVDRRAASNLTVIDFIFIVLATLSAISLLILARRAYKGTAGTEMLLFGVLPALFFCFWLILIYKNNASNPVLLSYCYQVLAISAATIASYYSAGFVYHKPLTGRTIVSFLAAIYFCAVVLADNIGLPIRIIFGVTGLNMLLNSVVFLKNLKPRRS